MSIKNIYDIIDESWKEAENENNKGAIKILEKSMYDFPEKQDIILLELAKIYFKDQQYLKALERYMVCYNYSKNDEILNFLLYCYYEPNIEEYKKIYDNNMMNIKNYKYFYGNIIAFEDIKEKILWKDEKQIIYYNNNEILRIEINIFDDNLDNNIVILSNEWNISNILECEKKTRNKSNFLTLEVPMYLYYDETIFFIVTQLMKFQGIIENRRVVIIIGEKRLEEFFDDPQAIFPNYAIGKHRSSCINILENCSNKIISNFNECKKDVIEYYKKNSLEVLKNIKDGTPRILFFTTRFSTVIQYHVRDCMQVIQEMELKTDLIIEKSDIHRVTDAYKFDLINKLKPDIIFCIDHFRYEFTDIPEELVWVTWVQDPLPNIMDKNSPGKLSDRDFVLSHYTTWTEFIELNYPKERLIDAPVPSNHKVYKEYEITKEEKEIYSCDICFVCHAADFDERLSKFLEEIQDDIIKGYLRRIAYEYYDNAYRDGQVYYSKSEFKNFFTKLLDKWNYKIDERLLEIFVVEMYMWLNQRIFRQILVNWLIDAGYENIKLWGNGWIEHEKYKKYAMGPAQNGEQLSKIYQCSKINLGNNIMTTAAARAWESMLSGGFYMSNYIPSENDITDIRKILSEDEVIMFYDKEDFLSKIKYYLKNEDKRLEMIEIGQKCALERMTFEILMKNMIKNMGKYYGER